MKFRKTIYFPEIQIPRDGNINFIICDQFYNEKYEKKKNYIF